MECATDATTKTTLATHARRTYISRGLLILLEIHNHSCQYTESVATVSVAHSFETEMVMHRLDCTPTICDHVDVVHSTSVRVVANMHSYTNTHTRHLQVDDLQRMARVHGHGCTELD